MELRYYQKEAMHSIIQKFDEGNRSTLLVMATGTGKTIVFSKLCEHYVKLGKRILILAHREELLEQAADKLAQSTGLGTALEKAESTCLGSFFRVVVGSVQTLMSDKRLSRFKKDYFDLIIVDEAHRIMANSYLKILDYFSAANVLGVTATPERSDMKNLGQVLDSLAYEYGLARAIKDGFLVKIKALTLPLKLDLSAVATQAGDFKTKDLGTALDPYLESIADEMVAHCSERKTVVFLPLVATSQKFCDLLNKKGFRAVEINGNSKDRKEVLRDFKNDKYNIITCAQLLIEGWDDPSVDCVIMLRPTKVRSMYCQAVGRGTRLFPGKDHLLLLDFLWHTERHELCRPTSLITTDDEVVKQATKIIEEEGCALDLLDEVIEKAESDTIAQREEALAKQLEEMKKRKRALVDPLQFEMSIQAEDLVNYVPEFGWQSAPPSDKQVQALEKLGILPDQVDNAGKASLLLDRLDKRKHEGLTTPKQIRLLERYGFNHVGTWQFENAKNLIARIAASGWRIPNGINPKEYKPNEITTNYFTFN